MGFEVYVPQTRRQVEPGTASLNRAGCLKVHSGDLRRIGVASREVAVLIDRETMRLAIRTPRGGDGLGEPSVMLKLGKKAGHATINIAGALRRLGLDPASTSGTFPLAVKEDLLIVQLSPPKPAKRDRK